MSIARGTSHILSVEDGKDGEDAVWYEIIPDTYSVSLDADGNWADGTNVVTYNGEECARIFCTYIKHKGSEVSSPSDFLTLVYGEWFDVSRYTGPAFIKKTDTAVDLSLYTLNQDNPPTYAGTLLARITVTVNRAGVNGTSVKAEFSRNGMDNWHETYQVGDKYMRLWNGTVWSAAIKFVGDDGNSFNTKGTVMRHYAKTSAIPSPVVSDKYIVDVHDVGSKISKPCYVEYVRGADTTVVASAEAASVGDAYVVQEDGSLWVANEKEWVNLGQIQGPKGDSVSIVSKSIRYAIAASGTQPPSSTSGDWKSSVQTVTSDKPYLWTWTHVGYSDGNSTDSYSVTTRGNKGAVFRQHDGLVSGDYSYQSGSGTEEFIDAVRVKNVWYRCIKSYSSKDAPAANDVTNTKYWSSAGMTNVDFIATQLLLAEGATINMLGTNEINLYESDAEMFGSFRVPHNTAGVDGDVDGGEHALWLGGKTAEEAPFSVTKGGKIRATSGKIGSFDIYSYQDSTGFPFYYLHASTNGAATIAPGAIDLGYRGLEVRSQVSSGLGGIINIGYNGEKTGDEFSWGNGFVSVSANFGDSKASNEQTSFSSVMSGNRKNDVIGYSADINGGKNNYALKAKNGDILLMNGLIRGFRPMVRHVSSSITLQDEDCVLFCVNSSEITLTLPSSPKKGQMYIVYQAYARVFVSSANPIITHGNNYVNGGTKKWDSDTWNQMNFLIFTGEYWMLQFLNH